MKRIALLALVAGTLFTSAMASITPAQAYDGYWRHHRCYQYQGFSRPYYAPTLGQRLRWSFGM